MLKVYGDAECPGLEFRPVVGAHQRHGAPFGIDSYKVAKTEYPDKFGCEQALLESFECLLVTDSVNLHLCACLGICVEVQQCAECDAEIAINFLAYHQWEMERQYLPAAFHIGGAGRDG